MKRATGKGIANKVLIVGPDPCGQGGIASVVAIHLAEGLADRFDLRYIVSHAGHTRLSKAIRAVAAFFELLQCLWRGDVALVHVHSASGPSFLRKSAYLALARAFGVRTVFHLHGGTFHKFVQGLGIGWRRRWVCRTLRCSDRVLVLSSAWSQKIAQIEPDARIVVLENPVRTEGVDTGVPEQLGRVVFLGRADKTKGIEILLDAMVSVRARHPYVKLVVGGDGDLLALGRRAESVGMTEAVEILGWLGARRRDEALDRAQVFALPSFDEGLPMAMLEAMAHGKAVVVTPVGGIPDVIVDGINGLLVPPGDPAALADAIERVVSDPPLARRLGQAARLTVVQRHGAQAIVARLTALYEQLGVSPGSVRTEHGGS